MVNGHLDGCVVVMPLTAGAWSVIERGVTARAFASAALVALVFDRLRRKGIAPPEPPPGPGLRHAAPPLVAHGQKRDLLSAVMRQHGPVAILRVGEAVAEQGFQPMLHALLRARGPEDLVGRWLRLGRYAHSHHRTVVERFDAGGATMRHVSTDGRAPAAGEDLLVFGVYLGLLRATGCHEVAAEVGGEAMARPDGGWDRDGAGRAVSAGTTAAWHTIWSGWGQQRHPPRQAGTPEPRGAPALAFDDCTEAAALAGLFAEDPARHLTLAAAAGVLGLSPRGPQRRLAVHGLTVTAVARAVQVRQACALLAGTEKPLPVIGYVCGFSDQAHFTRQSRKRVAMAPGAYRNLLRMEPGPPAG